VAVVAEAEAAEQAARAPQDASVGGWPLVKFLLVPKCRLVLGLSLVAMALPMSGCQLSDPNRPMPSMPNPPPVGQLSVDDLPAGMPASVADRKMNTVAVQTTPVNPRPDPFALRPIELGYEAKQEAFRIFGQTGGFFPSMFTPIEERFEVQVVEPQPYRRLAGVLVGDTVTAIIDMGGGRMHIVRPGQQIPNSPWRVVSIDEEKAVLRRSGNVLPKEIVVRLESSPFRP
jgi:hypothetical protein